MVLSRNVEQDKTVCWVQEWQLCLSHFWHYLPLLYLTVIMHCFHVRSVSRIPFGIFLWYLVGIPFGIFLMILDRNVEQDKMTCCIQEWQLWFSYFWSYLPLFYFWNRFHVRSVSRIPFGIFLWYLIEIPFGIFLMILDRNVEQDKMTRCIQEWQLWFSNFGVISLFYFWNWFHVYSVSQIPFGIFFWYLLEM